MQNAAQACFQDEFYRYSWGVLPRRSKQQLWSFLPGLAWGIEILRDGDRLREHCAHF